MRWVVAVLAALALTCGVVASYADRAVFDADGFANRVDASLRSGPVAAELGDRLTGEVLRARPDLVAVRPLIAGAAESIVRGAAFRSLARGAARDVHRSVFDRDASTVTWTIADVGVLVSEALARLRPDLAQRLPDDLAVRVSAATSDAETAAVQAAAFAERVRGIGILGLVVFALLAAVSVWRWRRAAVLRLGVAVAVVAGTVAALALLAPRVFDDAAARAVVATWTDPLAAWCGAIAGAGAIAALAAAAILRPVALLPRLWAASPAAAAASPRHVTAWFRLPVWLRAIVAVALGAALLIEPLTTLELTAMAAGLILVLAGASELLRLAGDAPAPRLRRFPRPARVGAAAVLLVAALGAAALAAGDDPAPVLVGRCNGDAALCDKRLDEVVFAGTHNSMSAEGEPGWLFAAQDASIEQQLEDGVRALLIDTHYGFATPRGVATDLEHDSKSREKIESEVGPRFVETAQRLRTRIGFTGDEEREIFLCHAFCEVGATRAQDALEGVHRFLVAHPEEVLILSIEDDTEAEDTARLIRDSGLIHEVYRGPARPPWPTLRELIERNERVLVLIENDPGTEPWMHKQSEVTQETPYRFRTAQELAAPDSCAPNRGGDAGSLLLVNHWVDTSPAPRKTIAREVNARPFLTERLTRCQRERGLLPNVVAVDFYRQGNVIGTLAAQR